MIDTWRAWRQDQLIRNSFFLIASSTITSLLGFLFWIAVARLYTPAQVGVATTLISASSLIAYFSLFGLNSTLIRFPASKRSRNAQVTQAIALVAVASCLIASAYLFGLPWYGPKLSFVRANLLLSVVFVAFCVFAAVNLLTDAVFIGERVPKYNTLVDGGIQGLTKLVLPPALLGLGSFGIVGASGGGYLAAVLASLFFMRRRLGFRFDVRLVRTPLVEQVRFSAASYIAMALALAPITAIPLITLQQLGAAAAGYYYVAFQIASLLYVLSHQVGEAVFAEVSHEESRFAELLRRSAIIVAVIQLPASVTVIAASDFLLQIFGDRYATHARTLLIVLVLGALTSALNSLASFALKLARCLTHLVLSHIILATVAIGLTAVWASRGLVWIGWAWCIGNLAAGIYGTVALTRPRSHPAPTPAESLVADQEGHH